MIRKLLLILLLSHALNFVEAQQLLSNEFGSSSKIEFESTMLSGIRNVWIHVPKIESNSLDNPQSSFPVIYVLDGEHNFLNAIGISKALTRAGLMPGVIIVGIGGELRELDYSPSELNVDYMKTGGGPKFLSFLSAELIPFINKNYPATNHNTIVGHSIGGMFSFYALTENDTLFSNYLAISPSLWWDDQKLADQWKKDLNSNLPESPKKAFVTMANEATLGPDGEIMVAQYEQFKLEVTDTTNLQLKYLDLFEEDHLSTVTPSLYYGFKYLFQDWDISNYYSISDFAGLKNAIEELSNTYNFNVTPSYRYLVDMGRFYHTKGDYETAIAIYEYGLKSFSEGLMILGFAAQSYIEINSKSKAREYLEKGLKLARLKESPMIPWFENQINKIE